ncbi:MAG: hypothetical protein ACPW61_06810 [Methyloligella sp. ZOD6]
MTIRRFTFVASLAAIGAAWAMPAAATPGAGVPLSAERAQAVQEVGWFRNRRDETYYVDGTGEEHVRAPGAAVDVRDGDGTRVRAPFADVDTQGGKVRVRAPFVNLFLPKD